MTTIGESHSIYSRVRTYPFTCSAAAVWLLIAAVVAILIFIDPVSRSVLCIYEMATAAWWSGLDMYARGDSYAYLPHFAVLFTPFRALGAPWGNVAWTVCSVGWLGWALWLLMRCLDDFMRVGRAEGAGRYFFFATLLSIALCGGAIRNGQANVVFAAATVHAVVMLMNARWSAAAVLLLVAVAIKPLGIVMVLLAPLVYGPLRLRLLLAAAVFVVVPFLFAPPAYVVSQYRSFMVDILDATGVTEHRFANLAGIFRTIDVSLSGTPATVMSLVGAVAALLAWVMGARRVGGAQRGLLLLAITTSYLMLFNPMTESNSYIIVAPAMAAWAIVLLETDRRRAGWVLIGILLAIGLLPEPLRGVVPNLSLWAKPLATAVFIGVLVVVIVEPQSSHTWRGLFITKSTRVASGSVNGQCQPNSVRPTKSRSAPQSSIRSMPVE